MEQKRMEVDVHTARKMLNDGAFLVDIREWEEVEMMTFDVEGMMWLPHSSLPENFQGIPAHKIIILGCRSGKRSLDAAYFLRNQGMGRVYSLKGGINDWIFHNFPVKWDNTVSKGILHLHEM